MPYRVPVEPYQTHELEFLHFGEAGRGPKVLVTAGIHGGEATGIWAAQQLVKWLGGQELKGEVTVLPIANPPAFRALTRTSPFDDMDMNRVFPGNPAGCPTLVTADTIWQQAKKADFLVDLHCCGIFGSDYTLACWQEFSQARELAAKLDIPVVIQSGGTRNQLFVEASHAGIPAVIIELAGGQLGRTGGILDRKSGENCVSAVTNLLRRLGVAQGEAPATRPTFFGKLQEVNTRRASLWSPAIKPGDRITEGQLLGDWDGEEARAPFTGVATSVRADSYVFPGDTVTMIAPLVG